jgi:carbonic anhydrase
MAEIEVLLEGYKRFCAKDSSINRDILKKLAVQGQSPKTLVIACSDSRVDPSIITDSDLGDIFVIRNVANLVPPFEDNYDSYHGTSAAIEFAVNNLQVKNIIVMGHSRCAGIHALLHSTTAPTQNSYVQAWMNIAQKAKDHVLNQSFKSEEEKIACCEREAIRVSLENLMTFSWVKEKVNQGELTLHGWYFSIFDHCLQILDDQTGTFREFEVK